MAVLLVSLASLCFYAWPTQPLWSLSFDMAEDSFKIIGVDEAKQIIYVNCHGHFVVNPGTPVHRESELRGYQLYSGKLIWRLPDTDEVFKDSPLAWYYWLSPDRSQVACHEHTNETIQVRAFPSCKLQFQIKVTNGETAPQLLPSYSNDGSRILVQTKDKVQIYDSSSGELLVTLLVPELPEPTLPPEKVVLESTAESNNSISSVGHVIPSTNGNWAVVNHPLQISNDNRFIATVGSGAKSVLVFHVPDKKLLAQLPFSGIPRFLAKDNTLLLVPEFHLPDRPVNNQLKRYAVSENGVSEINLNNNHPTTRGETLCCEQRHLVTNEVQIQTPSVRPFWADWEWLPDGLKIKLAMFLYAPNVRFDIYDADSGNQKQTFHLPLGNVFYSSYLQRNWLSSDGKLLALNDGTTLAIWETHPRRPLVPWLILGGTILVSFYFAWPRRTTSIPPAASPHAGK